MASGLIVASGLVCVGLRSSLKPSPPVYLENSARSTGAAVRPNAGKPARHSAIAVLPLLAHDLTEYPIPIGRLHRGRHPRLSIATREDFQGGTVPASNNGLQRQ